MNKNKSGGNTITTVVTKYSVGAAELAKFARMDERSQLKFLSTIKTGCGLSDKLEKHTMVKGVVSIAAVTPYLSIHERLKVLTKTSFSLSVYTTSFMNLNRSVPVPLAMELLKLHAIYANFHGMRRSTDAIQFLFRGCVANIAYGARVIRARDKQPNGLLFFEMILPA